MKPIQISSISNNVKVSEELKEEDVEFVMTELQAMDNNLQLHALIYIRNALQKPYAGELITKFPDIFVFIVGLARDGDTDDIRGYAIEDIALSIKLPDCPTRALEKTPHFCDALLNYLQNNAPWIEYTIAIISFLFDFEECRETFLSQNIIQILAENQFAVDVSPIISQIFRFYEITPEVCSLIPIIYQELEIENNITIANALSALTSLIQKLSYDENLAQSVNINIDEIHSKILQLLSSDDKTIQSSAFRTLEVLGVVTEADVNACCLCLNSNDSATYASRYLEKCASLWAETYSDLITKAVVDNLDNYNFSTKRQVLKLLNITAPYITDINESLPNIFGTYLSDKLIGRQLIKGLYQLCTRIASNGDGHWFFSSLEDYLDDIESYTEDKNQSVAECASHIIEFIANQ
ncbi:hypothetical protein TVAG_392720 [Trichomonas vaginalis G3]|uniref:Uncharacterized protein n=1 Tax=Trichomonas vaginalis (strain ATCC PRA-98 / G3) TaxID=412133 RepID=A2DWX3_TRIV3|nr:armadillo (ARM) repeat-containing protein family [Trichomonas vaginalis G3]EAY15155.1 hypothetical protein TVAG_392720 [Trichomonas vaginalis G3]KAI5499154.1 armadillo (ARM) repeat-containing protein family [Trichomonas vaginalis G3]|eukprot:XP_001327378.1 hypothetical protein [Trichomonas vaginalis G3]